MGKLSRQNLSWPSFLSLLAVGEEAKLHRSRSLMGLLLQEKKLWIHVYRLEIQVMPIKFIPSTHHKKCTMIETNTSSKQSASKKNTFKLEKWPTSPDPTSNIKHQNASNKNPNMLRYTCHYNVKRGWSSTPLKTLPGKGSGHKTAWQLLSPANKGDRIFGMFANQPNVKPEGAKVITSNLCFWWLPL